LRETGRLLLVGNPSEVHVGSHLRRAAQALEIDAEFCDSTEAYAAQAWRQKVEWWARGHRPARLREFSDAVTRAAALARPRYLLTTGIAPLDSDALEAIGALGVVRLNFLTDDPWNPAHRAPWFLDALRHYDHVFSPRHANLADLGTLEGPRTSYLPFGYAPDVHFPQDPVGDEERRRFEADVMFAGGADADRVDLLSAFIRSDLRVALYGGYWEKSAATRPYARGFVDAVGLRLATRGAKVCLCLVRHANRDGHTMRSFEAPAMGGCLLVEDTADHRALFGDPNAAVAFFGRPDEAVTQARRLAQSAADRTALAAASHHLVTSGRHAYSDRLAEMLRIASESCAEDRSGRSRTLSRV
jgi:spore maturation protein CgeB